MSNGVNLSRLSNKLWLPSLVVLLFASALFWAKRRDPFDRIWFTLKTPHYGKLKCIAILPKPVRSSPVAVYVHGSGGSLLSSGTELRQMAEIGLAVVGMEYNQTNEFAFTEQFIALHRHLQRQKWANTNAIAWVGSSLGAQRTLSFALNHPEMQPQLLVRVAGGWVPELEQFKVRAFQTEHRTSNRKGLSTLLIHDENDSVFPVAEARRVAGVLQSNGVPVELKVLPGQTHNFDPNRILLFRVIGEYCLTRLSAPDALTKYRSIALWEAQAKPLWLYWIPAFAWISALVYLKRREKAGQASRLLKRACNPPELGDQTPPTAGEMSALHCPRKVTLWEIGLRWVAAILAILALAQTSLHLITPRLAISEMTLMLARKFLVQRKEMADFDVLATNSYWRGYRLKTLLEHVELANYNRELVNWKVDEALYREFVLSPLIASGVEGGLNWRRPLWESFYPRIRKEQDPGVAAQIVARHLRERVTVACEGALPGEIRAIWTRQITDESSFQRIYVAALRSVGIPARLDSQKRAEFWTGSAWKSAPRPIVLDSW